MPAILLALMLAVSLLTPATVCADEASEKALKLLKKKKIKVPKSGVPVDLSKLKQPQLDPWVMWWMRPYLVPGTQNAPKKKAKLKLPKIKAKAPEARPVKASGPAVAGPKAVSLTLSPRFSPMGGNHLNEEITLGLSVGFWPAEQVGVEWNLSVFPRRGVENARGGATATLALAPTGHQLESIDRIMAFSTTLIGAPFAGTIAPPGAPPVFAEFLVGVGIGVERSDIEMLLWDEATDPVDPLFIANEEQIIERPVANFLIGSRIFPKPGLGLRIDARLLGGPSQVLDFSSDDAALVNNQLIVGEANRSSCSDPETAVCKTKWEGSFTLELGIDISLGTPRGSGR
jgi:hypothetical protein